ncbi:MAG TPA: YkvA family protein [Gemmatimonadota bacterium]|nr:YkvA family protein [Gemmatimonadota bacterium]
MSRVKARSVLRDLALFLPHFLLLLRRLASDPRVPRRSKLIMAGTVLYLVSPLDIVPDFVPGLGQLDDIVIVLLALHSILNRVDESVILEHWPGEVGMIQAVRQGLAAVARLLPGNWDSRV